MPKVPRNKASRKPKRQKVKDKTPMTSMYKVPKHVFHINNLKVEESIKKSKEVKEKDIFELPKNKSGY